MTYPWKKQTAVFLSSQAVSLLGSSLVQYAITWHITLTTKSGLFATLAILCGFLPTLLFSPFAGVWADRYNRRWLIILSDGGIALATLALALLWASGVESIWLLLGVMAIRSIGGAVQSPSISAMIPTIIPTDQLTRVSGLNSSIHSVINLISPMLSGALMGFAPLSSIFLIDVFTAAAAIAILLLFFRLPASAEKKKETLPSGQYLRELKDGIRYIWHTPYLRSFFFFLLFFWPLTSPISFLTPLQVARNYGDEVWRLTAIEVAFSVGMLAGGLAISFWGSRKNRIRMIGMSFLVISLLASLFGLPLPFSLYITLMALIGLILPFGNTPASVYLQEQTDPAYMGRVFSIMSMLSSSLLPLGMLIFGPLADVIAIEYLLVGSSLALAAGCVVLLRHKTLLRAGAAYGENGGTDQ